MAGITKFQLSHIENGQRGASRQALERILVALSPTLRELEDLQILCFEESIGIDLPEDLRRLTPAFKEMRRQESFREVHVVAALPIEVSELNERNAFLKEMIEDLKRDADRRSYTYWTTASSMERFTTFFHFLLKHGVKRNIVTSCFEVITCPQELCLLSFAIYAVPVDGHADEEYEAVGRMLIRNQEASSSFTCVKMGDTDLSLAHRFLKDTYDQLKLYGQVSGYRKIDVGELIGTTRSGR